MHLEHADEGNSPDEPVEEDLEVGREEDSGHPGGDGPQSFYHRFKSRAEKLANELELSDDRIAYCKVELEIDNGWVVVAVPKVMDITDLRDKVEVRHPNGNRLTPRPAHCRIYRAQPAPRPGGSSGPASNRPSGPKTGGYRAHSCWPTIAQAHAEGRSKEEIVTILKASGVDASVASKETRHWLKANGHWNK